MQAVLQSLLSYVHLHCCLTAVCHSSDYPTSVEHDRFVRDVLSQLGLDGEIPSEGLVTDYFVDFKTCTFKTWKERCDGTQVNRNGYITVPEVRAVSVCSTSNCWWRHVCVCVWVCVCACVCSSLSLPGHFYRTHCTIIMRRSDHSETQLSIQSHCNQKDQLPLGPEVTFKHC